MLPEVELFSMYSQQLDAVHAYYNYCLTSNAQLSTPHWHHRYVLNGQ